MKTLAKKSVSLLVCMVMFFSFICCTSVSAGVYNYQQTIDVYSTGTGIGNDVQYSGNKLHVAASVVRSYIPSNVTLYVYLVSNGVRTRLFTMPTNGSVISTQTAISIKPNQNYYILIDRYGAGSIPDGLQISVGCSSYTS